MASLAIVASRHLADFIPVCAARCSLALRASIAQLDIERPLSWLVTHLALEFTPYWIGLRAIRFAGSGPIMQLHHSPNQFHLGRIRTGWFQQDSVYRWCCLRHFSAAGLRIRVGSGGAFTINPGQNSGPA